MSDPSNVPVSVNVFPGQTPPAPPGISGISFDKVAGNLLFTFSDGTEKAVPGLAEAIASALGGATLAVLDENGALVLGGKPRLGVSQNGNLACLTALPDTTDGYDPVSGNGELYLNGSGPVQVA